MLEMDFTCVPRRLLFGVTGLAGALLISGCGSGGSSPGSSGSAPSAVTKVTVLIAADANDQITEFGAVLESITLTNSSGQSVTLLPESLGTELIHLNGLAEPLMTGTIPQGTYTAATITVGYSAFTCDTVDSDGGLLDSTYAYGAVPANFVSVSLPAPISVTGDSVGMTLRMLVQDSAIISSCGAST